MPKLHVRNAGRNDGPCSASASTAGGQAANGKKRDRPAEPVNPPQVAANQLAKPFLAAKGLPLPLLMTSYHETGDRSNS